jgi:hypothetical protein
MRHEVSLAVVLSLLAVVVNLIHPGYTGMYVPREVGIQHARMYMYIL